MALNNNIFCASNPAAMTQCLWQVMCGFDADIADMLIFLPSRRAVRAMEKMIVSKMGGAAVLPRMVPLGEGDADADVDTFSNTERMVLLARMLAEDAAFGRIDAALPVARDLVRMADYLENEGVDIATIDWHALVDEKYAAHFQHKAQLLNIVSRVMKDIAGQKQTQTSVRNAQIRDWIDIINSPEYAGRPVIVCGSTASVPATADLMVAIARRENSAIILPGKIRGRECDFMLATNPYTCEYNFLRRIGVAPDDVEIIDVGPSAIDFFNHAFGNIPAAPECETRLNHCHIATCAREYEEAQTVAEIVARAYAQNKTVLVITPDAAGNQRAAAAIAARGIAADFSGGMPAVQTPAARALLNLLDDWMECARGDLFDAAYQASDCNLFKAVAYIVTKYRDAMAPDFDVAAPDSVIAWDAVREISDCINAAGIRLSIADARAFLADALRHATVRPQMPDDARVCVLGTIESRMQTADVVILTGLNDGMFPARGYENAWLPRFLAEKIGLPPADRKVALQALDFMCLSCGADVYWIRSAAAGGVQTTCSRFLSRVAARRGVTDDGPATDALHAVRAAENIAPRPLDYSAPCPPADWSDVYVTKLELLIHNPYAFYANNILRLRPRDDYWAVVDARKFGTLVHDVIEHAPRNATPDYLRDAMDAAALEILGADSVLFHFWHRRFVEIAPVIANELAACPDAAAEIGGSVIIAGRNVRARADRVWAGGVMDIKTGAAPTKKQLFDGMMPQLPLEAYMLTTAGFMPRIPRCETPVIRFLQLKNRDARVIEYNATDTAQMMRAAVNRATELFNIYCAGGAPYEYRETGDVKYKAYDDLARVWD